MAYKECQMNPKKRREILCKRIEQRADKLLSTATSRIMSYKPVGYLSDLGIFLAKPKRGQCFVSIPHLGKTLVFHNECRPSKDDIDFSYYAHIRSIKLRQLACRYLWSTIEENRIVGNQLVLQRGEKLALKGLLDKNELSFLGKLRQFWLTFPEAKTGIVKGDTIIEWK